MAAIRRAGCLIAVVAAVLGATAASASAQETLAVTITSDLTADHLWSSDSVSVTGLATLPDGTPAAGRFLTVESRPSPYTGAFTPEPTRVLTSATGSFSFPRRPTRNIQLRVRGDLGQVSQVVSLRVFHLALSGSVKARSGGRQRATETSAVPDGYRLAKAYLYFCKPKAKRCDYMKRASKKVSGQRMTVTADFTPPERYAKRDWRVIFRYVPEAGWGDSTASERRKPKQTISNVDQDGS